MATLLSQDDYQALTGSDLTSAQESAYATVEEYAQRELERLLGYPLDPDSWDPTYLEIGKSIGSCPDVDTSEEDLDAPDAVEGSYRMFPFHPADPYLFIDPATEVHKVKLVSGGVTYYEYETWGERWEGGSERTVRYLNASRGIIENDYFPTITSDSLRNHNYHRHGCFSRMKLAVDADWAFETLPLPLKRALADLVNYEFDLKSDITSESLGSHSYSRTRQTAGAKYADALKSYAGPNGSLSRRKV